MTSLTDRSIAVLADTPPPTNGMTTVSAAIRELVRDHGVLEDLTVVTAQRPAKVPYRLRRHALLVKAALRLPAVARRGVRTVYLPADGGWGLIRVLATMLVARASRLQRILLHHHSYRYIDSRSSLMAAIHLIGGPRLIHVFLSDSMAHRFTAEYGAGNTTVIDNGLILATSSPPPSDRRTDAATIGMLSNLTVAKGALEILYIAAAVTPPPGRDLVVALAGPCDDSLAASIRRTGTKLGVDVRLIGPIYGDEKSAFLAGLDVFVFPTTYVEEASPLVVYEAMAAGAAVVAYDRGAIADQVAGTDGVVVPDRSAAAAAVSLILTRTDPSLRGRRMEQMRHRSVMAHRQATEILWPSHTASAADGVGGGT